MLQKNEILEAHEFMKKLGEYCVQYKVDIIEKLAPLKSRAQSTSIPALDFHTQIRSQFGNVGQQLTEERMGLLLLYL